MTTETRNILELNFVYIQSYRQTAEKWLNEEECEEEYKNYKIPVIEKDSPLYYIKYKKPTKDTLTDFWCRFPRLPVNVFTFAEGDETVYFFQIKSSQ